MFVTQLDIDVDDPRKPDVDRLLQDHLSYAQEWSLPDAVHVYGADRLSGQDIFFFSARRSSELVAIGALLHIEPGHAEIKSMHTVAAARGQGIGKAMLEHLVIAARERGYSRVSLETGMMDAFVPARTLYQNCGFEVCEPFADYRVKDDSVCMTLRLT